MIEKLNSGSMSHWENRNIKFPSKTRQEEAIQETGGEDNQRGRETNDAINWILNCSCYNWAFKLYQHSFSSLDYFASVSNPGNAISFRPSSCHSSPGCLFIFSWAKEVSLKVGMQDKSFRGKGGNNSTGRKDSLWQGPGQGNGHRTAFLKAKARRKLNLQPGCLLCPGIELGSPQRPVTEPETLSVLF